MSQEFARDRVVVSAGEPPTAPEEARNGPVTRALGTESFPDRSLVETPSMTERAAEPPSLSRADHLRHAVVCGVSGVVYLACAGLEFATMSLNSGRSFDGVAGTLFSFAALMYLMMAGRALSELQNAPRP